MGRFSITMAYRLTGLVTYSSQAFRDAARTRANTALSAFTYTNYTNAVGTGVTNVGTTQISFAIDVGSNDDVANNIKNALYAALTSSNRHTSGWISVNNY